MARSDDCQLMRHTAAKNESRQDYVLCVVGWKHVAGSAYFSGILPFCVPDVDGAELFAALGINQGGRASTVVVTSAWADLWPACISADDRAGYDVADAAPGWCC